MAEETEGTRRDNDNGPGEAEAGQAETSDEEEIEARSDQREREFLEERFAPLRAKRDDEDEEEAELQPGPSAPGPAPAREPEGPSTTPSPEEPEPPLPGEFRRSRIQQFREAQRRRLADQDTPPKKEGEGSQGDRVLEGNPTPDRPADFFSPPAVQGASDDAGPPQAPQAPPANNWIPIGPSVLRQGQGGVKPATSGRTTGIAVAPGGARVYVAAANGGVWRLRPLPTLWPVGPSRLFPPLPPIRTAFTWAPGRAPAERTLGWDLSYPPTVANWNTEPSNPDLAGSAFYALAVDPADTNRVVGATRRGIYRREPVPPPGTGFRWRQKNLPGAATPWATSVVVARTGQTTTFYAASWGGPVYSSNDSDTWNQGGAGFPNNRVGRVGLAVRPDNPNIVYALVSLWDAPGTAAPVGAARSGNLLGVFRLDTSDGTWRQVTGVPNTLFGFNPPTRRGQGNYDNAIAVAPDNVNRIYLGGSTVNSGSDWSGSLYRCAVTVTGSGAATSVSATSAYIGGSIHADVHTIVFAPNDATRMWVGCDGGGGYATPPTPLGTGVSSSHGTPDWPPLRCTIWASTPRKMPYYSAAPRTTVENALRARRRGYIPRAVTVATTWSTGTTRIRY